VGGPGGSRGCRPGFGRMKARKRSGLLRPPKCAGKKTEVARGCYEKPISFRMADEGRGEDLVKGPFTVACSSSAEKRKRSCWTRAKKRERRSQPSSYLQKSQSHLDPGSHAGKVIGRADRKITLTVKGRPSLFGKKGGKTPGRGRGRDKGRE